MSTSNEPCVHRMELVVCCAFMFREEILTMPSSDADVVKCLFFQCFRRLASMHAWYVLGPHMEPRALLLGGSSTISCLPGAPSG